MIISHWYNVFEVLMPTPDYDVVRLWCFWIFHSTVLAAATSDWATRADDMMWV